MRSERRHSPCTAIQRILTETGSLAVHVVGTVLFLGGAVVMCGIWARATAPDRARPHAEVVAADHGVDVDALLASAQRSRVVYLVSIAVMVAALVFQLAIAFPLGIPNALLGVELVCVAAFGASWLAESLALLTALTTRSEPRRRLAAARLAMAVATGP